MNKYFYFGEQVDGYNVRVINEREARASAAIIFLFAFTGFMFVALRANFFWTELFAFTFLLEFFIRVLINPKYAPYMIIARLIVGNQKPEYVGAPQKRFAWTIGLILGMAMVYLIVTNDMSSSRVATCLLCIVFLYLEAAFGICVGCKMYEFFTKNKAQNCPGGVCEMKTPKEDIQKVSIEQILIATIFLTTIYLSQPYVEDRVYAMELTFEELEAMDDFNNDDEEENDQ